MPACCQVCEGLWIVPSWSDPPNDPVATTILLEPGRQPAAANNGVGPQLLVGTLLPGVAIVCILFFVAAGPGHPSSSALSPCHLAHHVHAQHHLKTDAPSPPDHFFPLLQAWLLARATTPPPASASAGCASWHVGANSRGLQ